MPEGAPYYRTVAKNGETRTQVTYDRGQTWEFADPPEPGRWYRTERNGDQLRQVVSDDGEQWVVTGGSTGGKVNQLPEIKIQGSLPEEQQVLSALAAGPAKSSIKDPALEVPDIDPGARATRGTGGKKVNRTSFGQAYTEGALDPFGLGSESSGVGAQLASITDPSERAATRGISAPLRQESEYRAQERLKRGEQAKARADQPEAYGLGRAVTETIATAPAALVAPVAGGARVATLAAPSIAEALAAGGASAAPYGALAGAGESEKEGLAALPDAVEGAFWSTMFGGALAGGGTALGNRLTAPRPGRAARMQMRAQEAGELADRARTEAVGGTGAAYKRVAERYGLEATEGKVADAAERLLGSEAAQTPADYARRSAELRPELGKAVGTAVQAVEAEMPAAAQTGVFFSRLADLQSKLAKSPRQESQGQARYLGKLIDRLRAQYGEQGYLSPTDLQAIKSEMAKGGYPNAATKATPSGQRAVTERQVSDVARGLLSEAVEQGEPIMAPQAPPRPPLEPGEPASGLRLPPDDTPTMIPRVEPLGAPAGAANVQVPRAPAVPREMAAEYRQMAAGYDVDPMALTMRPPSPEPTIPGAWPEGRVKEVLGNRIARRAMTPAARGGGPPSPAAEAAMRRLEAPVAPAPTPEGSTPGKPMLGVEPPPSDTPTMRVSMPDTPGLSPSTARQYRTALEDYGAIRTIEDLSQRAALQDASRAQFGKPRGPNLVDEGMQLLDSPIGYLPRKVVNALRKPTVQTADEAANMYRALANKYGGKAESAAYGGTRSPAYPSMSAAARGEAGGALEAYGQALGEPDQDLERVKNTLAQDPGAYGPYSQRLQQAEQEGRLAQELYILSADPAFRRYQEAAGAR